MKHTGYCIHAFLASVLAFAGCFTLHRSEYPQVVHSRVREGATPPAVQLSGFRAVLTTYVPVVGYGTMWRQDPGFYHHGRYHGGYWHPETYSTTTYIPQSNETDAFISRAADTLEDCGFRMAVTNADYIVDVKFDGPFVTDEDRTVEAMWLLLSVLSADYGTQTWTAKLRIHDAKTGQLEMKHDYSEKYQAVVWGPLPILSPAGSDQTERNTMQSWCLTALTDRAMADATAFLASKAK